MDISSLAFLPMVDEMDPKRKAAANQPSEPKAKKEDVKDAKSKRSSIRSILGRKRHDSVASSIASSNSGTAAALMQMQGALVEPLRTSSISSSRRSIASLTATSPAESVAMQPQPLNQMVRATPISTTTSNTPSSASQRRFSFASISTTNSTTSNSSKKKAAQKKEKAAPQKETAKPQKNYYQGGLSGMDAWAAVSYIEQDETFRAELTIGDVRAKIMKQLRLPPSDPIKLVVGGRTLNNDNRNVRKVMARWGDRPLVCIARTEALSKLDDKHVRALKLSRADVQSSPENTITSLTVTIKKDDAIVLSKGQLPEEQQHQLRRTLRRPSTPGGSPSSPLRRSLAVPPTRSPRRSLDLTAAPLQDVIDVPDAFQRVADGSSTTPEPGPPRTISFRFILEDGPEDAQQWLSTCPIEMWRGGKLRSSHFKQHVLKQFPDIVLADRIHLMFKGAPLLDVAPLYQWRQSNAWSTAVISVSVKDIFTVHLGEQYEDIQFSTNSISSGAVKIQDIRAAAERVFEVSAAHRINLFHGNKPMAVDGASARSFGFISTAPNNVRCQTVRKEDENSILQSSSTSPKLEPLLKVDTSLSPIAWDESISPTRPGLRARDCVVCGDTCAPFDFPKQISSQCNHEPATCIDCLTQWVASELDAKGWDKIRCPECPALLQHHDIKAVATKDVFERYDTLATRAALSDDPDFHFCLSPTSTSGQLHPSPSTSPIMTCHTCSFRTCLTHSVVWHEGETCAAYEYRTSGAQAAEQAKLSEAWMNSNSKKCPGKGCGWMIEKNEGCDHMRCRKCAWEFCWECLCDYEDVRRRGNAAHERECRHWRAEGRRS